MLEEIGQIVTGKTPSSNVIGAFSSSGIPFVTPKDMDGRRWIETTERYLSEAGRQSLKNYLVPKDSVAVSCIGSDMGKAILLKKDSVTNQQINTIIVDASKYNPKYIYYVLSLKQEELKSIAGGSATPILNKGHFSKVVIELPDKVDQDNIVQVLDSLDCKIELNNQINQSLESIAQAIFKSWFIDFDPVRAKIAAKLEGKNPELAAMCAISGKSEAELEQMAKEDFAELQATAALFPDELVESELGEVPKGWDAITLGNFLEIKRGGSPRPIQNFMAPTGYPWVKIADATADPSPFLFKTKEFIIKEGLRKTVYLKKGSLILTNSATPGLPKFLELDACIHDGWLYFPQKKHFSDNYLYFLFLKLRTQLVAQGNGSVFTNLKTDILRNQVVLVPTKEVIEKFDFQVGKILEMMKTQCIQSSNLSDLRDTLLPKLLSGKVSVLGFQGEVA